MIHLLLLATALSLPGATSPPETCTWNEVTYFTNGQLVTELEMVCHPAENGTEVAAPTFDTDVGEAACTAAALQFGYDPQEFCVELDLPAVTGGMVVQAFRKLPLPPSELEVQPPNGRTLVNFDTNFYTVAQPLNRSITLLGQRVDLRIWASEFGWKFGDGASQQTRSAGSAYPDLEITHNYENAGAVTPSVDTTYAAEFRVNDGPWRPVAGTVTIGGQAVALDVVEATPTLVGYR